MAQAMAQVRGDAIIEVGASPNAPANDLARMVAGALAAGEQEEEEEEEEAAIPEPLKKAAGFFTIGSRKQQAVVVEEEEKEEEEGECGCSAAPLLAGCSTMGRPPPAAAESLWAPGTAGTQVLKHSPRLVQLSPR